MTIAHQHREGSLASIGFIGSGSMGGVQARELAKLTIPLTVFDLPATATAKFEGRATRVDSIAGLGACDVIGICVQNDERVTSCFEQLQPLLKANTNILIYSTVRPDTVRALAERAAVGGAVVLVAPVTRTEMHDDGPFVFSMLGGDADVVARVRPVLDAYSTEVMAVGPVGLAMALKICSNLGSWCEIAVGLELVNKARAAGVAMNKLLTVTKRNGVMTPIIGAFANLFLKPPMPQDSELMAVQSYIGEKDLTLAGERAAGVGVKHRLAGMCGSAFGK